MYQFNGHCVASTLASKAGNSNIAFMKEPLMDNDRLKTRESLESGLTEGMQDALPNIGLAALHNNLL